MLERMSARDESNRIDCMVVELEQFGECVKCRGDNPVRGATTIPIVFVVGDDPVRLGLVGSLARPGRNLTGINFFIVELAAKRLELLRELVPKANRVAVLVDPTNPTTAESTLRDVEGAARAVGLQTQAFNVTTSREIDAAFASLMREWIDMLFVPAGSFFADNDV